MSSFFTHAKLQDLIPTNKLQKYEKNKENKSFQIFHDKCYQSLNYTPGENTYEDQVIKILLLKYFFLEKSNIVINNYNIDSNQRIIFKNNIKAKLTEKEIKLILTKNHKQ